MIATPMTITMDFTESRKLDAVDVQSVMAMRLKLVTMSTGGVHLTVTTDGASARMVTSSVVCTVAVAVNCTTWRRENAANQRVHLTAMQAVMMLLQLDLHLIGRVCPSVILDT